MLRPLQSGICTPFTALYPRHLILYFIFKSGTAWGGGGGGGGGGILNSRLQATHAKLYSDLTQVHSRASLKDKSKVGG